LIPPTSDRLNLLNYIHPHACRVDYAESPLPPRFIRQWQITAQSIRH
jgi:hypothetical protein